MEIASPSAEKLSPAPSARNRGGASPASGPLLKTEAAAEYLAISPRQVQYLSQRGDLPCIRIGTSIRYVPADLDEFVGRCRQKGAQG